MHNTKQTSTNQTIPLWRHKHHKFKFNSILIETQIEIKIRISKKRKMTFKFIFQKLRNEKMQFSFFKKLIFWIILSIRGLVNYLNFVFHIEVKKNLMINFWISFFNLSKTRNGTLGTRIIYQTDKSSLISQSNSINSNFVSILIEIQIESNFRILTKQEKLNLNKKM